MQLYATPNLRYWPLGVLRQIYAIGQKGLIKKGHNNNFQNKMGPGLERVLFTFICVSIDRSNKSPKDLEPFGKAMYRMLETVIFFKKGLHSEK